MYVFCTPQFTIIIVKPLFFQAVLLPSGALADFFHLHKRLITLLMSGAALIVTLLLPSVRLFLLLAAAIALVAVLSFWLSGLPAFRLASRPSLDL
jgi:hypothetical protein